MSLSRRAATELCRTGAFWSPATSQSPAVDRLRAHQARGEERPSALPPVLLAVHLAVARRPAREARQLPHVLVPPTLLQRRARRLGGAAAAPLLFAGRHLDGAAGALLHAAVARALLLDPVAPALLRARASVLRLRTRGAAQGAARGAAQGAALGLEPKAGAEGGGDQGSRRGRGCGAGMRCYQQVNGNVWGV